MPFVDIEHSAFLEIFRNQDQLLLIPVIANRISLIWIRFFNKHYGKEDFDHWDRDYWENKTKPKDILIYASSLWCCEITTWVTEDYMIKSLEMLYLV